MGGADVQGVGIGGNGAGASISEHGIGLSRMFASESAPEDNVSYNTSYFNRLFARENIPLFDADSGVDRMS